MSRFISVLAFVFCSLNVAGQNYTRSLEIGYGYSYPINREVYQRGHTVNLGYFSPLFNKSKWLFQKTSLEYESYSGDEGPSPQITRDEGYLSLQILLTMMVINQLHLVAGINASLLNHQRCRYRGEVCDNGLNNVAIANARERVKPIIGLDYRLSIARQPCKIGVHYTTSKFDVGGYNDFLFISVAVGLIKFQ